MLKTDKLNLKLDALPSNIYKVVICRFYNSSEIIAVNITGRANSL